MAITLADIQVTVQDDVDFNLIDETRRNSVFLDALTFDDAVSPGTAGGTLTYGYTRLATKRAADTRQENHEYPAREAKKERQTLDLIPLGSRYNIDRVYANLGDATTNEVIFQQGEARKATIAKFQDLAINGTAADFTQAVPGFDGLDAMLTGTSTESFATGTTPWDFSNIVDKAGALAARRAIRKWLALFDGTPTMFLVNRDGAAFLQELGDWTNYYTESQNPAGVTLTNFGGIPFVDLGEKDGSSDNIIGTDDATDVTSIYAVRLGLDSVHGVATRGSQILKSWLPDFSVAGAVKPGEIELGPVAIAAKRTRGAGVFRVKVRA